MIFTEVVTGAAFSVSHVYMLHVKWHTPRQMYEEGRVVLILCTKLHWQQ